MPLLALVVSLVTFVATTTLSITMWRVGLSVRRFERLEDGRREELMALEKARREDVKAAEEARRRDLQALSAAHRNDVDALEKRLHVTSEKLVDARFQQMTHDLNGHVHNFKLTLDALACRLTDGEAGLTKLVDVDHALEIKTLNRMEQIKDYVRDTCASKQDVREHEKNVAIKFDRLGEKVQALTIAVTSLGKKVGEHA